MSRHNPPDRNPTTTAAARRRFLGRRQCLLTVAASTVTPSWPSFAGEWTTRTRVGRWYVHTTFPLTKHDSYAELLDRLERQVQQRLELPQPRQHDLPQQAVPPHGEVVVVILANEQQYRRYIKTYFPRAPRRPALFVQASGPGIVLTYRSRDLHTNLRHEATHGLLHAIFPFVPLWLDEGLAEYFETPTPGTLGEYPHWRELKGRISAGQVPSLTRLETLTKLATMDADDYRAAWSWIFFLLHASRWHADALRGYLQAWQRGVMPLPLSTHLQHHGKLEGQYLSFWRSRV